MEKQGISNSQLAGINDLLSEIFFKKVSLNSLLHEFGYTEKEIDVVLDSYLEPLIQLVLDTLKEFLFTRKGAERFWFILRERYCLTGSPSKSFQQLGSELHITRMDAQKLEEDAIRKLELPKRRHILLKRINNQVSEWLYDQPQQPENWKTTPFHISPKRTKTASRLPRSVLVLRKKYPRAYELWSEQEEQSLIVFFQRGKSVQELSGIFQRQPTAIRSRLEKFDLVDNRHNDHISTEDDT